MKTAYKLNLIVPTIKPKCSVCFVQHIPARTRTHSYSFLSSAVSCSRSGLCACECVRTYVFVGRCKSSFIVCKHTYSQNPLIGQPNSVLSVRLSSFFKNTQIHANGTSFVHLPQYGRLFSTQHNNTIQNRMPHLRRLHDKTR